MLRLLIDFQNRLNRHQKLIPPKTSLNISSQRLLYFDFDIYIYVVIDNWFSEPIEPPPKTYTTKDKFEYFKPTVQVEMDHPDKGDTVNELFIKGQISFVFNIIIEECKFNIRVATNVQVQVCKPEYSPCY